MVSVNDLHLSRDSGGELMELIKRNQAERLAIAFTLVDSIWKEFTTGKIEDGLLQEAVYLQTDVNRIIWKLNDLNNRRTDDD